MTESYDGSIAVACQRHDATPRQHPYPPGISGTKKATTKVAFEETTQA